MFRTGLLGCRGWASLLGWVVASASRDDILISHHRNSAVPAPLLKSPRCKGLGVSLHDGLTSIVVVAMRSLRMHESRVDVFARDPRVEVRGLASFKIDE